MRPLGCMLALVVASGCYVSHERTPRAVDGGPQRDADARLDAPPRCAEDVVCDDGDPCTTGDRCVDGSCIGAPMACDPGPSPCTRGACVAGRCEYEALTDGTACDDGDACTTEDVCAGGTCAGAPLRCDAPPPAVCVDDEMRRAFAAPGVCEAGACRYATLDAPCPAGCAKSECRCAEQPWTTMDVDPGPPNVGGPSDLAVDAAGGVHVVHRGNVPGATWDWLSYAHLPPGGAWEVERLGRGRGARLTVDATGTVHVLYSDADRGAVHAFRPAGASAWEREALPGTGPQMLVDGSGTLHVRSLGTRSPAGIWNFDAFQSYPLALDPSGAVHAVSVHYAADQEHFTYPPGGPWTRRPLTPAVPMDHAQLLRGDLFIDGAGGMHLVAIVAARYPSTIDTVQHLHLPAGGDAWEYDEHPLSTPREPGSGSLAMAPSGTLHVAYVPETGSTNRIAYLSRDPAGTWSSTEIIVVNNELFPANWVIIAADEAGGVHLAFDDYPMPLRYGYRRICH